MDLSLPRSQPSRLPCHGAVTPQLDRTCIMYQWYMKLREQGRPCIHIWPRYRVHVPSTPGDLGLYNLSAIPLLWGTVTKWGGAGRSALRLRSNCGKILGPVRFCLLYKLPAPQVVRLDSLITSKVASVPQNLSIPLLEISHYQTYLRANLLEQPTSSIGNSKKTQNEHR